jgi:AcrR family transcriptional regulator
MSKTSKERILAQASRLFHEKGYAATSMREIAQAVGMEAASLYNHIKGKEDLLAEICTTVSQKYQENVLKVESSGQKAYDKLLALLEAHLGLAFSDPMSVTAFNDEWKHLPSEAKALFTEERRAYENYLQQLLRQAQADQRIIGSLDPSFTVKTMLSSMHWMYFANLPDGSKNRKMIIEQWRQLFMNGIVN